jgi:hypothetical protein
MLQGQPILRTAQKQQNKTEHQAAKPGRKGSGKERAGEEGIRGREAEGRSGQLGKSDQGREEWEREQLRPKRTEWTNSGGKETRPELSTDETTRHKTASKNRPNTKSIIDHPVPFSGSTIILRIH